MTPPLAGGVPRLISGQGSSALSQVTGLWPAPKEAQRTPSPSLNLAFAAAQHTGASDPSEPWPTCAAGFHPEGAEGPRSHGILARSLLAGTHQSEGR